jgi:hypothetical protein
LFKGSWVQFWCNILCYFLIFTKIKSQSGWNNHSSTRVSSISKEMTHAYWAYYSSTIVNDRSPPMPSNLVQQNWFLTMLFKTRHKVSKEVGQRRFKIGPMKWAKFNWSFDKLFSAWKMRHIMFYGDGKVIWIFRHCARDP